MRHQARIVSVPPGSVAIVESWQRHVTIWLLCTVITALIAWDVYAAWDVPHSDTISEFTLSIFWLHPSLPAAVGYLMGHLTWPNNFNHIGKVWRSVLLCVLGAVLFGLDFGLHVIKPMVPLIPFAVCVPLGHLLWPQILEE